MFSDCKGGYCSLICWHAL